MESHPHFTTGEPCYCGWGHAKHAELKFRKRSDSWEEIRNRKRYRNPQAQHILNGVQSAGLNNIGEKWLPWLLDQIRKGHIEPEWHVPCEECEQQGGEECNYCYGYGVEDCDYCRATGRAECDHCDGSGKEMEQCDTCEGAGEIESDDEDAEHEGIEGMAECPDCLGSGEQEIDCTNCGGDGEVDCEYCYGDGTVECSNCYGEGRVECPACDGSETVKADENSFQGAVEEAAQVHGDDASDMVRAKKFNLSMPVLEKWMELKGEDEDDNGWTRVRNHQLNPQRWRHWTDWLDSGHGTRRAFNPTNGELPDLIEGVHNWDEDMKAQQGKRNREAGRVLHTLPNGWTVRELGPEEVKDEGDVMGHCVGSYKDRVADNKLRVLSLRDAKGDPHCTTGVLADDTFESPAGFAEGKIYQHYGKGNEEPKDSYNAMLRQYFESLPEHHRPRSENWADPVNNLVGARKYLREDRYDKLGLPQRPRSVKWPEVLNSSLRPDEEGNIQFPSQRVIDDLSEFYHASETEPIQEMVEGIKQQNPDSPMLHNLVDAMAQSSSAQQPQPVVASAKYTHENYHTGRACNCPFGRPADISGFEITASRLDYFEKRPDMQTEEAKEFLSQLKKYRYDQGDGAKLLDWIIREWKQGHVKFSFNDLVFTWENATNADGEQVRGQRVVTPSQFNEYGQTIDDLKRINQGVNIMQLRGPQLFQTLDKGMEEVVARQRPNLGALEHEFSNGWSIKRLQNERECIREGKDLHHCVGNPSQPDAGHRHYKGMSYRDGVSEDPDESNYHLYSLRDKDNMPHATIELHDQIGNPGNHVVQTFADHDTRGPQEHLDMINDWLRPHGLESRWGTQNGDDYDNDQDEPPEQWWDDEYYAEPATDVQSYVDQFANGEIYEYAPSDYEAALGEVYNWNEGGGQDHGIYLDEPTLHTSDPEFDEVWEDLVDGGSTTRTYNPPSRTKSTMCESCGEPVLGSERRCPNCEYPNINHPSQNSRGPRPSAFDEDLHKSLAETAAEHGHIGDLYYHYNDWLDNLRADHEVHGEAPTQHDNHVYNFWSQEFARHINPETGMIEEPRMRSYRNPAYDPETMPQYKRNITMWETARDRYWNRNYENYPQLENWPQTPELGMRQFPQSPWMQDADEESDDVYPVPPSYWSKTARKPFTHYRWHDGKPCSCPWGEDMHAHKEHKTAARIDALKKRPDLQDAEGQSFLNTLQWYPDVLSHWLTREWKKGRIEHEALPDLGFARPRGGRGVLKSKDGLSLRGLDEWPEILEGLKRIGQGVNLMDFTYGDLEAKMLEGKQILAERERPGLGEIVHEFSPDGWTIRKLRNKREAEIEGRDMDHCVGGYGEGVEDGRNHIYSLRDPDNQPHATIQLNKDHPDATQIAQAYGPHDQPIHDEDHQMFLHDWLNSLPGLDESHLRPWSTDGEGEQWWDPVYNYEVQSPEEYIYFHHPTGGAGDYSHYHEVVYDGAPDDYQSACHDADAMGLDHPELEPADEIEWEPILRELVRPSNSRWNSEAARYQESPRSFENSRETHEDMFEALRRNPRHMQEFFDVWNRWKQGEEVRTGPHRFGPIADPYDEANPYHRSANNFWQQAFGQAYNPERGNFSPPTGPRRTWWDENYENYPQIPGVQWQEPENQITLRFPADHRTNQPIPSYMRMGATALYYRWTFAPETGEVEFSHNEEEHPAAVRYHQQMMDDINRSNVVNGYAYRIQNGWRITDDEHKPIEDPYVLSQVLRSLQHNDDGGWQLGKEDFDRPHYGLPTQT